MGGGDQFPWELLKAECLRLVVGQLVEGSKGGHSRQKIGRREEMIDFLRDVHKHGLEPALRNAGSAASSREPKAANDEPRRLSKRKSARMQEDEEDEDAEGESVDEHEDGYNTRFRGVKRVKVTADRPEPRPRSPRKVGRPRKSVPDESAGEGSNPRARGRPRKSVDKAATGGTTISARRGRPRKSDTQARGPAGNKNGTTSTSRSRPRRSAGAAAADDKDVTATPKRGRGRPRKSIPAPESKGSGKEVFDGVLLENRRRRDAEAPEKSEDGGELGVDGDADADDDGYEEDAVLAAVNGHAHGDLSSLGGSNKENDPDEISAPPTPEGARGGESVG
ncbi:hypothetical protein B0H34DRAFT_728518 [Crassisporium funariophilum]|nr:hypothetical protein B0H34DRAFT_728518 [Crassisporium funariophilum]